MDDDAFDRSVRDALEPDPGTVNRVVSDALARGGRRRPARGPLLAMAGALALLLGGLELSRDTRAPVQNRTRMTNVGDTIVVRPTSGGVWLIGAVRDAPDRLPAGTIVVYRSGEQR